MKMKLTALIATAAMAFTANTASAESLRIGVDIYPPFVEMSADGTLQGFDIDIGRALCEELNHECEWVQQDWDGIIPGLLAKKFDVIISSMSITEERATKVDFSKKYYNSPSWFAAAEGVDWADTNEGLQSHVVGVQRATVQHDYLVARFPDVEVKLYGTPEDLYADFSTGRLDVIFADSLAMDASFLKTDQGQGYARFGGDHVDSTLMGDGAGIAVRKGEVELVEQFNAAIGTIRSNGTYGEINAKYFDFDIYGG